MKNTLKSIKEFIKSDWKKTCEEMAHFPSKIKKIIWKIWSYRRFGVWFLVLLLLYLIWRMRPANFSDHMPEESDFVLSEIAQVSTGENLIYSFVKPELKDFRERYEALMQRMWWRKDPTIYNFPRIIKEIKLLQRPFAIDAYHLKDLDQDILSGRVVDVSFDEYFAGLSWEEIAQLESVFELVSWMMPEIESKDRIFEQTGFGRGFDGLNNAKAYAKTLNFLAGYACSKGETQKCIDYLKTSYLLGAKMAERNIAMGVSYGLRIKQDALLMMLYLDQQGKINLKQSDLMSLIQKWTFDADKLTDQTIKMTYWWMKSRIEGASDDMEGVLPLLFDKQETFKLLQVLSYWQLKEHHWWAKELRRWARNLDSRLFDWGRDAPRDAYEDWWRDIHKDEFKVFWRKNIIGLEMLNMFDASPYLQAKIVEDYEYYILHYLQ